MATYLVNARGKIGGMCVVVSSAQAALAKCQDFADVRFAAVVFDDRGRERSLQELEVEAENEGRVLPPTPIAS